ncbi:MAG: hypothetical protein Q9160_004794 [Pyrenula sp. 1 TL-2023]
MSSDQNQDRSGANPEQGFKPNMRPQSTIALSFASDLDNAFSLSPDLDNLSQSISTKQSALSSQNRELEALEARLRETEDRLKRSRANSPAANTSIDRAIGAQEGNLDERQRRNGGGKPPLASPRGGGGVDEPRYAQTKVESPTADNRPPSRKVWSRGRADAPTSRGSGR